MSVKEELNKPELIPSKWNRNTVADGTWLQKHTLDKLKERDDFLADAIDNLSGNTDDNLSGLSAAIDYVSGSYSSFYIDEYLQFKEDVESSAAQFDTDLQTEINNRIEKDDYHDEAIETIKQQIDTMNAATDVVDVWGTYSAFSAEWRDTYFPGGSALITNNDIIKIINDEYTEIEDNLTTGHQTYFRWVCNDPVPSGPDDGQWEYVGYTDPYYNRTEVDDKILGIENTIIDLSGTVADNYLSAKGAVHQGHNIKVTEQTGPVIEIATKDNVDFTELSADTAWVDTISANVSAFDFYETTSGKRLSETQQGLFINTTASPFDTTKSASEGDVFWPSNFEQIFSAWYDTDKLINIKYTNTLNDSIRLYTLHNVKQYTDNNFTYYDLNFISNDDKVAYTAYAKVKRNGGEGGGAPTGPVLYECDEGPIDVEYTGEHGVYVSGDHQIGLSSEYETALKEGSAASAWINTNENKLVYTANFNGTEGVITGYGESAFAGGISSISAKTGDSTALFTGYNVNLQAGEGVGFNFGTNLLTISAKGKTYTDGDYIHIDGTDNNSINVTGTLINSAQSGQSAYDWITTKSATLQAGDGIEFYSAGPNILGIRAEGTTYNAGNYISTANNTIAVTGGLITSAEAGSAASAWVHNTLFDFSYIEGPDAETTSGSIDKITVLYKTDVETHEAMRNQEIVFERGAYKVSGLLIQAANGNDDNGKVLTYNSTINNYTWQTIPINNGNYVSAANNQTLALATATTAITPSTMSNNIIYLV